MIQRNPNSSRKANLPHTTNDSNQRPSAKTKKNRHRSTSKNFLLIRMIGGTLLLFVVFLYIVGTRHILLLSSSASFSSTAILDDVLFQSPENGKGLRKIDSLAHKPRTIGYYFALADSGSFVGTERLNPNMKLLHDNSITRIFRGEFMTKKQVKKEERLLDSDSYEQGFADKISDQGEDCVAQYDWQEKTFPTCNTVMEVDGTNLNRFPMFHEDHYNNRHDLPLASSPLHSYTKFLAEGGWRNVWKIENFLRHEGKQEEIVVLKMMLYEHDYTERNFDRHRRDAIAMAELSSSKFIMDIYAFCGNSGLFQYADGGSLADSIKANYGSREDAKEKPWTSEEKMVIAYQAASGLADLHNVPKEGVPAIAHTDITENQYVYIEEEGVYKLNDFNRARFMAKNSKTNEVCRFKIGSNVGKYRSPEEYDYVPLSEKIDIYSLGNILYDLLTSKDLFYNFGESRTTKAVIKAVQAGKRSPFPDSFKNSTDPFEQTLIKAIKLCWIHDPKDRISARELQTLFMTELERQGVNKTEW